MAFSGKCITHNFGVTASGGSKRPASEVDHDDDDDIPFARRCRPCYVPQPGDPSILWKMAERSALSTYGPNGSLTDSPATVTGAAGENTQPGAYLVGQQDEDVKLQEKGGEGDENRINGVQEDEIVEISSGDDEEDVEESESDEEIDDDVCSDDDEEEEDEDEDSDGGKETGADSSSANDGGKQHGKQPGNGTPKNLKRRVFHRLHLPCQTLRNNPI